MSVEIPIGTIVTAGDLKAVVSLDAEGKSCSGCALNHDAACYHLTCCPEQRSDNTDVIFIKMGDQA